MSKIFVCYSHKDKKYLDLLLKHFDNDLLDVWSDKRIEGGEHWYEEIQSALDNANIGLFILSANFFKSKFIKEVELQELLKNKYEKNTFLVPVLAEDCNIDNCGWINKKEVLPKGFKAIERIKKRNQNKEIVRVVKKVEELLVLQPDKSSGETLKEVNSYNYPIDIEVNNFPTSTDSFFGREKYFNILDKAWNNEQTNIISLIAFGGIGKTSLIDNWLKKMQKMHYKGASKVFMWSFYSQGSEEDSQVTATEFLSEACQFFKIKKILNGAYEKGRELAKVISTERAIIILDGLEPLQSSLENIGKVKDNGLEVFLKRLSRQNKGLVIITSRIKLSEIDNKYIELEKLEDYEGAELLKSFNLNGTKEEFQKLSDNFDGHALALKLLGSYTKVVLNKDISRINEIEFLTDDQTACSKHATRMLNSYKIYLKDTIELDILKVLGFFDKAISFEVIQVMRTKPLIESINDKLINVSEVDWNYSLDRLRQLHLISSCDNVLDAHPLVREYFSKYIAENYNESYVKGHHRLYMYYEKLPDKKFPDTLEEMEPLFHAIFHGCKANEVKNSYYNIYFNRLQRKSEFYLNNMLGAHYNIIAILNNFLSSYNNDEYCKMLSYNGIALSKLKLGKLKAAKKIFEKQLFNNKCEELSANDSSTLLDNLILCKILLGDISGAFIDSNKNIIESRKCTNKALYLMTMGRHAYLLYLKGDLQKSIKTFNKLEKDFIWNFKQFNYVKEQTSYEYNKLLIYLNNIKTVEKRAVEALNFAKKKKITGDIGLSYISLSILKNNNGLEKEEILRLINNGIENLRLYNDQIFLAEGLIERSKIFTNIKKFDDANEDLLESHDILINAEAKLLLADWYIIAIKLALDENNFIKANTYFEKAKELLKELDEYFIFKKELKKLELNFNLEIKDE